MSFAGRTVEPCPGGLILVYPLSEVYMPPIFMTIVNAEFDVDRMEARDKVSAQAVIDGLYEHAVTLPNYVAQQKIFNFLDWAAEKKSMDENFSQNVTVDRVPGDTVPELFQVKLTRDFCIHNDIHASAYLSLDPGGEASRYARIRGRVIAYDVAESVVKFVTMGSRANISLENDYEIRFCASSFIFRSSDRTLNWLIALYDLNHIIFPEVLPELISSNEFNIAMDKNISKLPFSPGTKFNPMQKRAIFAIVGGYYGRTPFVLHGPPGTGKTTTLVEAVRLLLLNKEMNARILVCTPSNTAADLFALELLKAGAVDKEKLFRMYSLMRNVAEQNQELRDVMCIWADDYDQDVFGIYARGILLERQVIVSTLTASTYLVSGKLRGDFTHIFIDEAGQATELQTLVPMVGLTNDTKIVLAGDPKQLGPMSNCDYISKNNMAKSLMERYSERKCYESKDDMRITCMLEENYRSHPAIIKIPSQLFYDDRLCAADAMTGLKDALCSFPDLPKMGFPIIWHNMTQIESREANGHSFCNLAEIGVVAKYVERIFETTTVKAADIGIISPYKYQVCLLRDKFVDHPEMTIDSVERFQGSERRVIIVSTVRSNALGFLDCDKRFNTTVMRAEELLIVVGNSDLLSTQPSWKSFVDYCLKNDAIIDGSAHSEAAVSVKSSHISESEEDEIAASTRGMNLNTEELLKSMTSESRDLWERARRNRASESSSPDVPEAGGS